jgi:23S rRNA (uracil1939-C5)-methyltransferase
MTPDIGDLVEVAIEEVGARGDGIARLGRVKVFVPLALPGDRLEVRLRARRGSDGFAAEPTARRCEAARARPPCVHFGRCGGCQLQHLPAADYAAWQRRQVRQALARRGLGDAIVEAPQVTPPASRRRVRLAFAPRAAGIRLGFRVRSGHELIGITQCPVALPEIVRLLPALRALLRQLDLTRRGGELDIMASASGLDLLLTAPLEPELVDRETLAEFATRHDLARVAWRAGPRTPAEPLVIRRPVQVRFAGVSVEPPPGAFLQATDFAEAAIRAAVVDAIGDARRIADLFAGCGTLGLPLAAAGGVVRAVDGDGGMLGALRQAAERAGFGPRITTEVRDLERAPLAAAELDRFDALILDPPRAGAAAQAARLAAARVPRVALVSCHPASFARDARILVEGGYRLAWVRPIDAFLWSSQIELVGALRRAG